MQVMSNREWNLLIASSTIVALLILAVSHYLGITIVIPHIVDIPIILFCYRYPRRAVYFTIFISVSYLLIFMVFIHPLFPGFYSALGRVGVFLLIGITISIISDRVKSYRGRFRDLFENLSDAAFICTDTPDEDYRIINCNKMSSFMLGYSPDEIRGKKFSGLLTEAIPDSFSKSGGKRSLKGQVQFRSRQIRKDGSTFPVEIRIFRHKYKENEIVIAVVSDISYLTNAEEKIVQGEAQLRQAYELSGLLSWCSNVNEKILFWAHLNKKFENLPMTGDPRSDYEIFLRIFEPLCGNALKKSIRERIDTKEPLEGTTRIITPAGDAREVKYKIEFFYDTEGIYKYHIGTAFDITELKVKEEKLRQMLEERTIMLKEIFHRVKNNLAMIISLISIQRRKADDEEIRAVLTEVENRIHAISSVHEDLYRSESFTSICADEYLRKLVGNLVGTMATDTRIRTYVRTQDCVLNLDTGIHVGMLVNEIVTNSIKYAFKGRGEGSIYVEMDCSGDEYVLIVRDDGIGFDPSFSISTSDSLGITLIRTLALKQLNGSIDLKTSEEGTEWRIRYIPCR